MVKEAGRFLQSVRTLFALSQFSKVSNEVDNMRKDMMMNTYDLEKAMAILQHHDAVAGTSVQKVADDYVAILNRGVSGAKKVNK
jgi:ribosome recycling factor